MQAKEGLKVPSCFFIYKRSLNVVGLEYMYLKLVLKQFEVLVSQLKKSKCLRFAFTECCSCLLTKYIIFYPSICWAHLFFLENCLVLVFGLLLWTEGKCYVYFWWNLKLHWCSQMSDTFAVSRTKILYNQAPQENSVYIFQCVKPLFSGILFMKFTYKNIFKVCKYFCCTFCSL